MKLKKKRSSDEERIDKNISLFVITFFVISAANSTIKTVIPIPQSMFPVISFAFACILGFLLIPILGDVLKRSLIPFVVTNSLFLFIYAISLLQNYNHPQEIFNNAFWTFCVCIPIAICVYSVQNKEILYDVFLKGSYPIVVILSISLFFHYDDNTYNMFFSYALITPLLLHINEYVNSKKKSFLILALYEIVIIVLYGSRGALLCLAAFILLKIIFGIKGILKKVVIMVGGLGLVGLVIIWFNKIGELVMGILENYGYYSRTLYLLFLGDVTNVSGRDAIWKKCIEMIQEKPLLGWGVGGEVRPLSIALSSSETITAHHGALELMLHYGIPIGMILSILVALLICRMFFIKNQFHKDLVLIYYCCAIVPMMLVGRQYLSNPQFFILLFLCLPVFKTSFVLRAERKKRSAYIFTRT